MDKFDKLSVIFRVVAVIICVGVLSLLPSVIYLLISANGPTYIPLAILVFGTPMLLAFLLWTRHGSMSDKVLEFLPEDDEIEELDASRTESLYDREAAISEEIPASEGFTRMEIESIAFTIIGAVILVFYVPSFILTIYTYAVGSNEILFSLSHAYLYIPILQNGLIVGIGLFLLLRSRTISGWLQQRSEREA